MRKSECRRCNAMLADAVSPARVLTFHAGGVVEFAQMELARHKLNPLGKLRRRASSVDSSTSADSSAASTTANGAAARSVEPSAAALLSEPITMVSVAREALGGTLCDEVVERSIADSRALASKLANLRDVPPPIHPRLGVGKGDVVTWAKAELVDIKKAMKRLAIQGKHSYEDTSRVAWV